MKSIIPHPCFIKKLSIIVIIFLSCCNINTFAQDEDEEDGGVEAQDRPDPDVPDVPLDGGVILLLTGGVGYGLLKAYQYNKKQQRDSFIGK